MQFSATDDVDVPATQVATMLEQLFRLVRRISPSGGHSVTSYSALSSLDRHGEARLTELAVSEGVSQPTMTQAVARLRNEGLVAQLPDPTDGRAVLVSITDAGRETLADRRATRAANVTVLLDQLDAADRSAILSAVPALENLAHMVPDPRDRQK